MAKAMTRADYRRAAGSRVQVPIEEKETTMDSHPGVETTEFRQARSSGRMGLAAILLGALVAIGPCALPFLAGTPAAPIAGAAIIIAGVLQKTITDVSYIKSRTEVKTRGR